MIACGHTVLSTSAPGRTVSSGELSAVHKSRTGRQSGARQPHGVKRRSGVKRTERWAAGGAEELMHPLRILRRLIGKRHGRICSGGHDTPD